jgi:uncharacterized protein YbjT (DUF2867 family)
MSTILVTGGTGALGSLVVPLLVSKGHEVRVLSRRENPPVPPGVAAVRGDLTTGEGVEQALQGVDAIVHCASGTGTVRGIISYKVAKRTDVDATQAMLELAKRSGSPYVLFISIVGVDKIPLPYYRAKLDTENVIERSGLPYTIFRATQFHSLGWEFGRRLDRSPVIMIPRGVSSQLVDQGEVAARMVELMDTRPPRAPDMGGPETLGFRDIMRKYLHATGKRRAVMQVPLPGKAMAGFLAGHNLTPDHPDGRITFDEWLAKKVGS